MIRLLDKLDLHFGQLRIDLGRRIKIARTGSLQCCAQQNDRDGLKDAILHLDHHNALICDLHPRELGESMSLECGPWNEFNVLFP
jgi:hypothetical protein